MRREKILIYKKFNEVNYEVDVCLFRFFSVYRYNYEGLFCFFIIYTKSRMLNVGYLVIISLSYRF